MHISLQVLQAFPAINQATISRSSLSQVSRYVACEQADDDPEDTLAGSC